MHDGHADLASFVTPSYIIAGLVLSRTKKRGPAFISLAGLS